MALEIAEASIANYRQTDAETRLARLCEMGGILDVRYLALDQPVGASRVDSLTEQDALGMHVVRVEDSKVVAAARFDDLGDGLFKVCRMATHPDYQGKGHGAEVMGFGIDAVRKRGATTIVLESRIDTRGFYSHLGFNETGRTVLSLLTGDVNFEMVKEL